MLHTPFYDPTKSYEYNYEHGPFGAFAQSKARNKNDQYITALKKIAEPLYDYHGNKIYTPFGIPPGPLINSAFVKSAFAMGFDICVYKTVRSDSYPCHSYPNILALAVEGDLPVGGTYVATSNYQEPLSITNSFGVPSKPVEFWQEDVKKAIGCAEKGQVLVLSFMGTVRSGQTEQEFIDDHKVVAEKALETGVKLLELNLSCPNIGNEGLICYNLGMSEKILKEIRKVIGRKPLTVKLGHFKNTKDLESFVHMAQSYVQGIASVNTLLAQVVNEHGKQALPGPNRLKSGICGSGIKWAGLDMTRRLKKIREDNGYEFIIESMGGVMNADDYFEYKDAGADVVMSATGAM